MYIALTPIKNNYFKIPFYCFSKEYPYVLSHGNDSYIDIQTSKLIHGLKIQIDYNEEISNENSSYISLINTINNFLNENIPRITLDLTHDTPYGFNYCYYSKQLIGTTHEINMRNMDNDIICNIVLFFDDYYDVLLELKLVLDVIIFNNFQEVICGPYSNSMLSRIYPCRYGIKQIPDKTIYHLPISDTNPDDIFKNMNKLINTICGRKLVVNNKKLIINTRNINTKVHIYVLGCNGYLTKKI